MAEPIVLMMPDGVKFETEMSIESCRAHALQAAATFLSGTSQTREDVVRTAEMFCQYIANGSVPARERSW